jgi:hypothetical protein
MPRVGEARKKPILHMGLQKTGTSSIQVMLAGSGDFHIRRHATWGMLGKRAASSMNASYLKQTPKMQRLPSLGLGWPDVLPRLSLRPAGNP